MAKFNSRSTPTVRAGQPPAPVLSTQPIATGTTFEGAPGYIRDAKSELFLLAVGNMLDDTFYETAQQSGSRLKALVHELVLLDPAWMGRFVGWLRGSANMRSVSILVALESARSMVMAKRPGSRSIVAAALQRADEPGEALAYWLAHYGKRIPKPVKRGIGDAVRTLYRERNTIKYDTSSHAVRFGDVLELCHPYPAEPWQGVLFEHLITRRHNREWGIVPDELTMLVAHQALINAAKTTPEVLLNTARLSMAGMTWEQALPYADRLGHKALWEAMIPKMGYMALLRNLRNFDTHGVRKELLDGVAAKLADPREVAASRQLPLRFLSAYRNTHSNNWGKALDDALQASLANVPSFPGRTLIMVDTSGSMAQHLSGKSQLECQDAAALFGLALAQRCHDATVVSFSHRDMTFPRIPGESLLRALERWQKQGYFQGGGTYTARSLRNNYKGHDRVVILTDEQAAYDMSAGKVTDAMPQDKLLVTFNLAGYKHAQVPSGPLRHTIGGLTDQAFTLLKCLDDFRSGWPF